MANKIKSDNTNCAVPHCSSVGSRNPDLSFFKFPNAVTLRNGNLSIRNNLQLQRREEWIRVLKIRKEVSNRKVVCSMHFKDADFTRTGEDVKHRRLKQFAVPSLFLPTDCVEKPLKKQKFIQNKENGYSLLPKGQEAPVCKHPVKERLFNEINVSSGTLKIIKDPVDKQLYETDVTNQTMEAANILLQMSVIGTEYRERSERNDAQST